MGYRKVSFVEGEFYHIYSRGNSKQKIFLDDQDRERFLKLLYVCNSENNIDFREDIVRKNINAWDFDRRETIVLISAWVLMPNHFHFYLTLNPRKSDFRKNKVTEFMRKVLTSYSKYFNKKHGRTGGLFEGKFQSVHVAGDVQAKYLFSYIHLNPVKLFQKDWKEVGIKNKNEAIKFLDKYKWSSYKDYLEGSRVESKILDRKSFSDYFSTKKDFQDEIFEWITFNKSAEVRLPQK